MDKTAELNVFSFIIYLHCIYIICTIERVKMSDDVDATPSYIYTLSCDVVYFVQK